MSVEVAGDKCLVCNLIPLRVENGWYWVCLRCHRVDSFEKEEDENS
jgi:hypothetical protein